MGILISVYVGYHNYNTDKEKAEIRFKVITNSVKENIYNKMDTYREVLYSGLGFFEASENVTRDEWHIFIKTLKLEKYFPGIQGIGYSVALREDELEQNIADIKAQGFETYKIFPEGKRELYTSIIYLEPFDERNQRAFGYDMYSETIRRKAMNRAIETGLPALSGKVKLVQEDGTDVQTGFLLYTPYYKKNMPLETKEQRYDAIEGFVYAVFRTKDLIVSTIEDSLESIDVSMYDGKVKNESSLLYASAKNITFNKDFNKTVQIELDGHDWIFEINAKESFFTFKESISSFIFSILGLFITLLIANIIKRRLELEIFKEEALFNVSQGVLVTDAEHKVIYSNKGFENLTGYSSEFIYGKDANCLQGVDTDQKTAEMMHQSLEKLEPFGCEILNYKKDGTPFWNQLSITPIFDKKGKIKRFIGIYNDITEKKLLEKDMLFEKNILENIFNNTNAVIALIDTNGVMVRLNDYGKKFVGYTQEEISSEPFFWKKFIPESMRDKTQQLIIDAKNGHLVEKRQNPWLSYSGKEKVFEWSNKLLEDRSGKMEYIITVGIDITQNILAQEQHNKYQRQLELSAQLSGLAFWELNLQTNIFTFNDSHYTILGTSIEVENSYEMDVEHYLNTFVDEGSKQTIIDRIGSTHTRNKNFQDSFEYTIKRVNGDTLPVLVTYYVSYDSNGKADTAFGAIYNLTQQKERENLLIVAKEEAQNASKAKSEFLANMSHEIRTPLNGIIGLTNLVLETQLTEIQKNYLSKSVASSNALLHIINDILDYSKIEAKKIELEHIPFKLDKLFHQVSDHFIYEANKKDIELICTIAPALHNDLIGDPFRITQVLINLIGNAIKFTPKGCVDISANLVEIGEERLLLEFSVKDSGIGISKEKQKKLFQDFSQVDASSTREYGGSGLGLVISQKLAHIMGGDILVESTKDVGSTFSFRTKVAYKKIDYSFLSVSLRDKKALIVNSNKEMSDILEQMLKMFNLNTAICSDAQTALDILEKEKFDYVLVDWELSSMNGAEFIKTIDGNHGDKNIKTILISTYSKKEEVIVSANSYTINTDKILISPFCASTLFDILVNNSNAQLIKDASINKLTAVGKVLLVEDNDINLLVAKQNLQSFGLEVQTAENGKIAVDKVKNDSFDLVFMDIQMPIMDGYEATRLIREFNKDIPIVALSAAVMKDDLQKTQDVGMNGHLSKPIDVEKIKEVLIKYLKTSFKEESSTNTETVEEIIEGVELKELLNRVNNAKELAYQMLLDFANNNTNILEELDALDIDSKEFNSCIHKLKGLSGNLSLKDVFKYCNAIYTTNDLDKKKELFPKLKNSLSVVMDSINKSSVLKKSKSNTASHFSKDDLLKEVELLNNDMQHAVFIALERKKSILEKIATELNKEVADELEKALNAYDYKNAQQILKTVIGDLA